MTDRAKEIAGRIHDMRLLIGLWVFGLIAGERGRRSLSLMGDAALEYHRRILQGEIDG